MKKIITDACLFYSIIVFFRYCIGVIRILTTTVDKVQNRNPGCEIITRAEAIGNGEHQISEIEKG